MVILYSVRSADISAIGINGSDPIFLEVAFPLYGREKTVGAKIFVRRQRY